MSEMVIKRFINNPVSSNCYVLYQKKNDNCIIIDPGSKDSTELENFLEEHQLYPEYIILTHHHFDHIWGVNSLVQKYNCKLISSISCSNKIVDHKLNLSLFYDDRGFTTGPSDILVEKIDNTLNWKGNILKFYSTKGHTEACISVFVDENLFTGDALIKDTKIMTKFPGGSKEMLRETYSLYNKLLINHPGLMIYAGHGEIFKLEDKYLEPTK